jgi:type II secretory pathway component PulM
MRLGPHLFLGYTWAEWLAIITILGIVYQMIFRPIIQRLDNMNDQLIKLNESSTREHQELRKWLGRLDVLTAKETVELNTLLKMHGLPQIGEKDHEN